MKLHQLQNGNWIDLKTVTAIVVAERVQCWPGGPIHPARVIVRAGETNEVINCDDLNQANEIRDALAALANKEIKAEQPSAIHPIA